MVNLGGLVVLGPGETVGLVNLLPLHVGGVGPAGPGELGWPGKPGCPGDSGA